MNQRARIGSTKARFVSTVEPAQLFQTTALLGTGCTVTHQRSDSEMERELDEVFVATYAVTAFLRAVLLFANNENRIVKQRKLGPLSRGAAIVH
jgi:hypothetical protein